MLDRKLGQGVVIIREEEKKLKAFADIKIKDVKKAVSDLHKLIKVKFFTEEGRRLLTQYIHSHPFTWFSIGGFLCFIYDIIVTVLLTEIFDIWYMLSYAIALLTGLVFLYFFHSFFTFEKLDRIERRMFKFFVVMASSYFLNWLIVYIFTEFYYYHYFPSIISVTIVLSFFNYYINNKWVFRKYHAFE